MAEKEGQQEEEKEEVKKEGTESLLNVEKSEWDVAYFVIFKLQVIWKTVLCDGNTVYFIQLRL